MPPPRQLLDALGGVLNAREPLPGLVTGGQPELEHLAAVKAAGCDVVVDTSDPMEPQPFDAPAAVRQAGLSYVNIPLTHGANADGMFDTVRRTLRDVAAKRQRAVVFRNSGTRE